MDKYPCVALPKNTHSTMLNVLKQQNILHDLNSFTRQICIIPVGIIPHFAQSWKFFDFAADLNLPDIRHKAQN